MEVRLEKLSFKERWAKYKKEKLIPYFSNRKNMFYYVLFLIGLAFLFYITTIFTNGFTASSTGDYTVQGVSFYFNGYDDWWHFFKTGEFPFWDSSTVLGADNLTNNAFYYIFDPFFLICLFMPRSFLPHMMLISSMLKLILGTLFCRLLLKEFKVKETSARLFAICYGFGGWMIFYQWFVGFLGICAFFPLVLLGIEKILHKKAPFVLMVGLFLIGISNFYFLVPTCIGGFLYAMFRFFQTIKTRKAYENFICLGKGFIGFLAGISLSGFITLPAFLNVFNYSRANNSYLGLLLDYYKEGEWTNFTHLIFNWDFSLSKIYDGASYSAYYGFRWIYPIMSFLFPATDGRSVPIMNFEGNRYDQLASSLFVFTPLVLIFFASIIHSFRNKKVSHFIALGCVLSFLFIPFFYYMFLGFSSAYGRWEFFPYTLLVIYCATSFKERKKFKNYEFIIGYVVAMALMITCIYYAAIFPNEYNRVLENSSRIIVIIVSVVYLTVLLCLFLKFYKHKKFLRYGFLFLAGEITLMGAYYFGYHGYVKYFTNDFLNGKDNLATETEIFKELNSDDTSFFRVQSDRIVNSGTNINMAEDYNGLSFFHSQYNANIDQFLHWSHIMTSYGNWNGNEVEKRPLLEQFLGVKYYLTKAINTNYKIIYDTENPNNAKTVHIDPNIPFGYEVYKTYNNGDYTLYVNKNYQELGYSFDTFIDPGVYETNNDLGVYSTIYTTGFSRNYFDFDQSLLSGAVLETSYIEEIQEKYHDEFTAGELDVIDIQHMPLSTIGARYVAYDLGNTYFDPENPLEYQNSGTVIFDSTDSGDGSTDYFTKLKSYTNIIVIDRENSDYLTEDEIGAIFMGAAIRSDLKFSTFVLDKDNNVISYDNFLQMDNYSKKFRTFYYDNYVSKLIVVPMMDDFTFNTSVGSISSGVFPLLFNYSYDDYLDTVNNAKQYPLENIEHTYNTYTFTTNYETPRFIALNVPGDDGWTLKVTNMSDGTTSEETIYPVDGGMIGFMSGVGETKYELNFVSSNFFEGCLLTLGGLTIIALFVIYYATRRKDLKLLEQQSNNRKNIIKDEISNYLNNKK